jgi:hypothetical protein
VQSVRVAIVWRGDAAASLAGIASNERLRPVFDALEAVGIEPLPVVYRDAIAGHVVAGLRTVDGVLAWVDPIGGGETVAADGVWLGAHPDVIDVLGTKEVLYATKDLAFGSDVAVYRTRSELAAGVRQRLRLGPRVLKPKYGNAGFGVWKVERVDDVTVRVHGAEVRDLEEEMCSLDAFLARFADALDAGCVVDQPFQARVSEGIIRCYLVGERVVGFAHQGAEPLLTAPSAAAKVMGLPSPKTMFPADHADFRPLRTLVEAELPALRESVGITAHDLPVLWDADFLRSESDGYVLCEINCSCVTPFPPEAPEAIAELVRARLL